MRCRYSAPSVILMMFQVCAFSALSGAESKVNIGGLVGKKVNNNLIGMNVVYSHEDMETWKDGQKAKALKDAGISCLRYPGGHVVSFWDWEFPYHSTYRNFWDPKYIKSLTPEKKAELKKQAEGRMQLDDFFKICKEAKIEPIVGINMFQGFKFDRNKDAIASAVRLVKHCQKQTPGVKYYYLDNEIGHQPEKNNHVTLEAYIKLIPEYSKAIKAVQSDAKIIVNPIKWNAVGKVIEKVGEHIDIVDHHWYYNNRKWGNFYIEDWRKDKAKGPFEKKIRQFEWLKNKHGHDHIELGLLEWNLGPAEGKEGSDPSTALFAGLVQSDMLMRFVKGDVYMAASWPLMWKSKKKQTGGYRNFIDYETGKVSPSKHIFGWFSMAGGGEILESSSLDGLQTLAVLDKDGKTILVYILNKFEENQSLKIKTEKNVVSAKAQLFRKGKDLNDVIVEDVQTSEKDKSVSVKILGTSFTFLEIRIK